MRETFQTTFAISKSDDPRRTILEKLGTIEDVKPLGALVLVAQYIRPEKTAGGIIRTQKNLDEDIYQGKVGLIVAMGPTAFRYAGVGAHYAFEGEPPKLGDWVEYAHYDGKQTSVRGVICRWLESYAIRGIVTDPEIIY